MEQDLLQRLNDVKWEVVFRAYGNSHSTLIGLLVDWWIAGNPQTRYVLEPGFSPFHRSPKNVGTRICDAVLVERDIAKGIIEIEGSKQIETIRKMDGFFHPEREEYNTLEFGIFLAYQTAIRGRGRNRKFDPFSIDEYLKLGEGITVKCPNKQLAILILEKEYERIESGLRRNEYYRGKTAKIYGFLIQNGRRVDERTFRKALEV